MYHLFYEYLKSSRFFRIFCTLPVHYNKNTKPRPRFQPFTFLWFYVFALLTHFTVLLFAAYRVISATHHSPGHDTTTKTAVKLIKIFVTLNILIAVFRRRGQLCKCMNYVLYYEERAFNHRIKLTYKSLRLLLLAKKVMIVTTAALGNISCVLAGNSYNSCAISFITYNLTYIISSIVLTEFCGLVLTVRQHLIIINRGLVRSTNNMNYYMNYHFEMCELSKQINQTFSIQLVLIILRTFVEFLNSLHSTFKEKSRLLFAYDLFWSICAMLEFLFMLFVCKQTTDTCTKTSRILNLLHIESDRLVIKRNVFLLQIKHKHVKFTASGLFTIDNKMFLKMLGTSIAYLLIIIQFEK